MPPVGFELTISAGERPKTNALDRTTTGTGTRYFINIIKLEYTSDAWPVRLSILLKIYTDETILFTECLDIA
jgi:hypothetical protein